MCFQEHFNAGEGMEPCYSMCDIAISSLKKILALPGADTDLTNFHIAAWEDVRAFLSLFPAQRLQLTAPAIVAGGSHMAAPDTSQQIPLPAAPFAPLLLNYTESELTGLLTKLGLVGVDGQATPAASPGAWVGVFYALLEAEPSRITDNKAGASRAFRAVFGAEVSGRAIQNGLGKQKSEAERMKDRALKLLNG